MLPRILITLEDVASKTTKLLPRATEFPCRKNATVLQPPCRSLQYVASTATKWYFIATKKNRGNMSVLSPQPESLW